MITIPNRPASDSIRSMSSNDYQKLLDNFYYAEAKLDGAMSVLWDLMNNPYEISRRQRDQLKKLYDKYSGLLTLCSNRLHQITIIRHSSN